MGNIRESVAKLASLAAATGLLACGSAGNSVETFDNTGGPPPAGTSVAFETVPFSLPTPPPCLLGQTAVLARKESDIPVFNGNVACTDAIRTALAGAFAALTPDQAIGIFVLNLGGCARNYELPQVNRDGLVIRPWIIILDTALGARNAVCTTDAISYLQALRISSAAGATSMELHLARVNPNYPRRPDVPVF